MPERHNILQNNAAPSDASASASSVLPTAESIFTRSGKLRGKASRSVPRLRVVLAALASVVSIAFLVVFCSRFYERHALHDRRSRRLASSGDSDEEIDVCGLAGDEEEEKQKQSPHLPNLPAGDVGQLPLKKRLLVRVAEGGTGADDSNPQQQEQQQQQQQQQQHEALEAASALFP
ncbi:uncharacterized protein EMH_0079530 [Eimeria mitis]|uniref:Uncharacterized protein n=1 Tax=Eimeria mitis TaxID=44415 RepID=U6K5G0_9EIME|nr:uncharacterized protein EMH_0079530 [Eimeria mitis]CDJ33030.1 hypothetical protein, conserved [Eimeria mitis]